MNDSAVNSQDLQGAAPGAVAHTILQRYGAARAANRTLKDDMSRLKLVKMAYVAHGYHLAMRGAPLVRGPIQAWGEGPVAPEIDAEVIKRLNGSGDDSRLPDDLFAAQFQGDAGENGLLDDESEEIVDGVIAAFGGDSGVTLVRATWCDDTPWRKVYEPGKQNSIDNVVIRDFYAQRYIAPSGTVMGL